MGQYLSSPVTEKASLWGNNPSAFRMIRAVRRRVRVDDKVYLLWAWCILQESEGGQNDRLAYGLAAMQGWRVSMVRLKG
jgi:hypothetical protein